MRTIRRESQTLRHEGIDMSLAKAVSTSVSADQNPQAVAQTASREARLGALWYTLSAPISALINAR
jgi:hypothetical protein